jgi:hypothetical protein
MKAVAIGTRVSGDSWNAALLFARVRRGVALSFRDQLSRGGGLSSASTKRRVDASINSGLFMKQGLAGTAVKSRPWWLWLILVACRRANANSRVIVPTFSTFFLRMGSKMRLRIALPVRQQHFFCVIQSGALFAVDFCHQF